MLEEKYFIIGEKQLFRTVLSIYSLSLFSYLLYKINYLIWIKVEKLKSKLIEFNVKSGKPFFMENLG